MSEILRWGEGAGVSDAPGNAQAVPRALCGEGAGAELLLKPEAPPEQDSHWAPAPPSTACALGGKDHRQQNSGNRPVPGVGVGLDLPTDVGIEVNGWRNPQPPAEGSGTAGTFPWPGHRKHPRGFEEVNPARESASLSSGQGPGRPGGPRRRDLRASTSE